eukprot:c17679_g1_i1.p1 GENE.c17679_g1_i1~~c17679_g1_i1.p1  ORF type:complete len:350 (+),score=140.86 c17679_g1_i1:73-1122(+)
MRSFLGLLILFLTGLEARNSQFWDSNFDVPSGYKSYKTEREVGHRITIDDMAYGFEGFIDEGIESDVRAPTNVHESKSHHSHSNSHSNSHHQHEKKEATNPRNRVTPKIHSHHSNHDNHATHHHQHSSHSKPVSFIQTDIETFQNEIETDPTTSMSKINQRINKIRPNFHLRGSAPLPPSESTGIGGVYEAPPSYQTQTQTTPRAASGFSEPNLNYGELRMKPALFPADASFPQAPTMPAHPANELSWLIDSEENKGYIKPSPDTPEKHMIDNALNTIRGFFKKGAKLSQSFEETPAPVKETVTDGFGGWPQPFWWTRPPAWLDDIPGWMQRYEMKKASRSHSNTAYGA